MNRISDPASVWIDVAIGFAIAAVAGALLLQLLRRWQFRQTAYEDAPRTHQEKTGTPTMGGLVFLVALIPAFFINRGDVLTPWLLMLVFACAAVGFIDDWLAIRGGRNRGLRARTKFLATALIAVIFLRLIAATGLPSVNVILHAGTFVLVVPYWAWLLLGILAVTGTIHAVNLTDGLDGLATGSMVPPLLVLIIIAHWTALGSFGRWLPVVPLAIGGCFGFLLFNRYPAKMFMGDTGSLALGALLSGVAILTGEMLLLILIGGVFVAEALSVIAQVAYFKRTGGKRIFRMSPLHHHFELGGWHETTVTARFWLASVVLSLAGLAIAR